MRTANYKNDVLWALAYKVGLDPAREFLEDEADAYASFINAWVRRLYDAEDWPEWTYTLKYSVPLNHIVPYNAAPVPPTGLVTVPTIGRVFKVFLVDPDGTPFQPIDTPFKLKPTGVHVGFEHGPFVWIKFIGETPQFTSRVWNAEDNYRKGQLSYSLETGECYKSRSNGNIGNDPAFTMQRELAVELTSEYQTPNPGVDAKPQAVEVYMQLSSPGAGVGGFNDPPPNTSIFTVTIRQPSTNGPGAVIATATRTANGTDSLATILTALRTQLAADTDLATWTLTADTTALKLTISGPQAFGISATYNFGLLVFSLKMRQTSSFVPPIPATDGQPARIQLTLTQADIMPTCEYVLSFVGHDGDEHLVLYQSTATDSVVQILAGIAAAVQAAAGTDPFFLDFGSTIDNASNSITFSKMMEFSLTATLICEGSPWWELVQFPFALIDQVVTGAYSDSLKEQGQADKAVPEVQAVPAEQAVKTQSIIAPAKDRLTDQEQPEYTRYAR
jgi:hypothetical protein